MQLNVNEIYHNYILRIVIFSLFTFKRQIRQPEIYTKSVTNFVNKRIPWKINLKIKTSERFNKETERDIFIDEILNGVESNYLSIVNVTLTTPLKDTHLEINLKDESKYEKFLYS
jgi:hypothetical protein